jgi:hypothetical protein
VQTELIEQLCLILGTVIRRGSVEFECLHRGCCSVLRGTREVLDPKEYGRRNYAAKRIQRDSPPRGGPITCGASGSA